MILRQILRTRRFEAGLTQEELAKRAQLHVNTITMAETGHQRPRGRTLAKIAKVLDLELEELLDLADRDGSA